MKKKFKYYIIIFLLIVGIYWVGSFNVDSKNYQREERVYDDNWREPGRDELKSIGKLIIQFKITGCGEYYLKLVGLKEYIVACTSNSKTGITI